MGRSLLECLRQAQERSPEIRNAALDLRLAELAQQSSAAAFYPQVGAAGSQVLLGDDLTGARIQNPPQWSSGVTYEAAMTADWNLFRSTRDWRSWRSARAVTGQARQNLIEKKQELALKVVQAFTEVLKQRKLAEVEQKTLLQRRDRLVQARTLFENGSRSYSDTLGQLTQVNAAERSLSLRISAAREAGAQLTFLLGEDPAQDLTLEELADKAPELPFQSLEVPSRDLALKQRPELQAQRYAIEARRESWNRAWLEQLPLLSLDGSFSKDIGLYGKDRALWTHTGQGDENSVWRVTAKLSVPLFEGFANQAAADTAGALEAQADNLMESLRRQVLLEVRLACLNLEQSLRTLALDKELVEAARKNLAEVQRGYENGTASLYEVNDADTEFLSASIGQVNTLYDTRASLARWKRAVGSDLMGMEKP
ncbi:MAG: TolC family protein [candidate division FCPU426 bacterium]